MFIAIEGLDGSGKSVQARLLKDRLEKHNRTVLVTAEPSTGPIGAFLRGLLTTREAVSTSSLAALFLADRLDHIEREIRPLIWRGCDVVCDRYVLSSLAYQGVELGRDWIWALNARCLESLIPDLTIYIDVDPTECLSRIRASARALQSHESPDRLRHVREQYASAIAEWGDRSPVITISGDPEIETVANAVWDRVRGFLPSGTA